MLRTKSLWFVIAVTAVSMMSTPLLAESSRERAITRAVATGNMATLNRIIVSQSDRNVALAAATDPNAFEGGASPDNPTNKVLIARLLRDGADPNLCVNYSDGALASVVRWQPFDPSEADLLVRYGAKLNAAVGMACAGNGMRTIQWFVTHGGDVNAKDTTTGDTAVFGVSEKESVKVVEYLVKCGAKLNVRDRGHMTALVRDLESESDSAMNKEGAYALIVNGADVNLAGPGGMTPLMYLSHAVRFDQGDYDPETEAIKLAKLMVAHGAKVDAKDVYGHTAAQLAKKHGMNALAAYLGSIR